MYDSGVRREREVLGKFGYSKAKGVRMTFNESPATGFPGYLVLFEYGRKGRRIQVMCDRVGVLAHRVVRPRFSESSSSTSGLLRFLYPLFLHHQRDACVCDIERRVRSSF